MNSYEKLINITKKNSSLLCVGLDSDIEKIPVHLRNDLSNLLVFNQEIIESTKDLVCSYKINFAFYEQYGQSGFDILKKTIEAIPEDIFIIADAKRGDIGNTSTAYARSCFEYFRADSITVSPYMGSDSVRPFLEFRDKFVFLLALTSNPGSNDFQRLMSGDKPVYKHVIELSKQWAPRENLGFVVGATHPDELEEVRELANDRALLIPGVGTQGGDIDAVLKANRGGTALINVSRAVIYSSNKQDYADKARQSAEYYKNMMTP